MTSSLAVFNAGIRVKSRRPIKSCLKNLALLTAMITILTIYYLGHVKNVHDNDDDDDDYFPGPLCRLTWSLDDVQTYFSGRRQFVTVTVGICEQVYLEADLDIL